MRKYYKYVLYIAAGLSVLFSCFFFLPSAWQQYVRLRINLFFFPPWDVDVKRIVFETGTMKDVRSQIEQNGILIHIKNNKTSIYINDYRSDNVDFLKGYKFNSLKLSSTEVAEIFPLKESGLTHLGIVSSPVHDLLFVKGCEKLETVYISTTRIKDLCPLKNLKSLKRLSFVGSEYVTENIDLSPLGGLVHLESLRIVNSKINDLSPLINLKRLRGLTIRNCEVSNFSVLSKLTNLDWLDLDETNASNIKSLSSLKKLKDLHLNKNNIRNIGFIEEVDCLEELHLDDNPIEDLTPLKHLKNLKFLYLNNTNVKDLSPLKNLRKLEFLDIQSTPAAKLSLPEWTKSIRVEK